MSYPYPLPPSPPPYSSNTCYFQNVLWDRLIGLTPPSPPPPPPPLPPLPVKEIDYTQHDQCHLLIDQKESKVFSRCQFVPIPRYSSDFTVCWLLACLTSQQHASVSQGRICTDNFTSCHTEIEAADQTFYLTQSQYTDTGPTSPALTL